MLNIFAHFMGVLGKKIIDSFSCC